MTTPDEYNYDKELDDSTDSLQFGKYSTLTPSTLLVKDPAYLVWCWENTTRWIGSEVLVRDAYKAYGKTFKPRNKILPTAPTTTPEDEQERIKAFEQAVYDTWGCFPKPTYAR